MNTTPKDSIRIFNTGLVLLHPYLPEFYKRLNLLKDGNFISTQEAIRAVFILEYLVSGSEVSNQILDLNKLLCNIPPKYIIKESISLTSNEILECNDLLISVINNWHELKNVSIEGFRTGFLKRKGELQLENPAMLIIEDKNFDILLDSCPWDISMIKSPWMNHLLYVEWKGRNYTSHKSS